jgi:hypothetical protein
MFNVSSYLEKFRKMAPDGDVEKRAAERAITESIGMAVEKGALRISGGVLYVSVSGALKAEIYMNKSGILKKIQEILGDNRIKDIR